MCLFQILLSPISLVPVGQQSWILYPEHVLWLLFFQIVQSGRLIVSTKCGHVFCSQCLRDSLRNANSCPTCRKKLTHGQYHPIYIWVLLFLRTDSAGFWGKMSCFQCSEDLKSSRLSTHPNKTDSFWVLENNLYLYRQLFLWSKLLLVTSLVVMLNLWLSLK